MHPGEASSEDGDEDGDGDRDGDGDEAEAVCVCVGVSVCVAAPSTDSYSIYIGSKPTGIKLLLVKKLNDMTLLALEPFTIPEGSA